MRRADVHGVNVDAVDLGEEMVVGVELSLEASPVVAFGPVGAEFLAYASGMPWLQSSTGSGSAQRVRARRSRRSAISLPETLMVKGRMAFAHRAMLAARWPHRNLSRRRLRTTMTLDSTFVSVLDYLGVFVFALSGAWLAIRRDLDLVGVVTLGLVTGLAGGVVRDVLVAALPPVAVREGWLLAIAGGAAIAALLVPRPDAALERLVVGLDAVGLGLFAIVGATKAAEAGIGIVGGMVVGTVSAIGGGLLRDVLADEVPQVFRGSRLYVIPALLGSLIVGLAWEFDLEGPVTGGRRHHRHHAPPARPPVRLARSPAPTPQRHLNFGRSNTHPADVGSCDVCAALAGSRHGRIDRLPTDFRRL